MARGRLIFPFLIDLAQLNTDATAADPDGAGPLTSGYDEIFREPVIVPPAAPDSSARGTSARVENVIQLPAQLDTRFFDDMAMMATGRSATSRFLITFHYKDLEALGLVDVNGTAKIKLNDRLAAVSNIKTGVLIEKFPNPPGLFCTEARSNSFGLGTHRNLLICVFEQRSTSMAGRR